MHTSNFPAIKQTPADSGFERTSGTGWPQAVRRVIPVLVWLFPLMAALALVWPVYRSFLAVKINDNEGWNAFYQDAAMGRMPLYPSPDKLITNNYTPLSYYVVGAVGRLTHDNVLAGRWISLAAMVAIGVLAGLIVRQLGGSPLAGIVAGSWYVITMCLFFDQYVGMNEPQLLALAIMSAGFLMFLRADRAGRGYWLALAVLVLAGFFKHNTLTLPFSALFWLLLRGRWSALFRCAAWSALYVAVGFALCRLCYGRDFFFNFFTPRTFSWDQEWDAFHELGAGAVVLAGWLAVIWFKRRDDVWKLVSTMVITGLVVHFLQRTGDGVDVNSQFDLMIALSITTGIVFSALGGLPQRRWCGVAQVVFLLCLIARIGFSDDAMDFTNAYDPDYRDTIKGHEEAMAKTVAAIKAVNGPVRSDALACYWAGKPFVIDEFNMWERINTGRLPSDVADKLAADHKLTVVAPDPKIEWSSDDDDDSSDDGK